MAQDFQYCPSQILSFLTARRSSRRQRSTRTVTALVQAVELAEEVLEILLVHHRKLDQAEAEKP